MKTKLLLAAALMLAFVSCNKQEQQPEQPDPSKTPYDYSLEENWMVRDFKGKDVDVFYVYPTVVMTGYSTGADLGAEDKKTAYCAYLKQACMAEYSNMYAPYFRQGTMDYMSKLANSEVMYEEVRNGIGKQDVFAALDYYFEHFNGGRPFILTSHSQGTAMMRLVLEEYMKKDETHKNYYKRMVAAYLLGFSCPKTWMTEFGLKGAERADDYGVIIAFNTEGPNATKPSIPVTSDDYAINPLTWTKGTAKADVSQNKGSFIWDDEDSYLYHIQKPGIADAQVDLSRVSLICTTIDDYVDIEGDPFGDKSLHTYDWPAYYENIKENAKTRIDAYFADHK